ncbi:hypothetical protein D3C87_2137930 [compost metagenome]
MFPRIFPLLFYQPVKVGIRFKILLRPRRDLMQLFNSGGFVRLPDLRFVHRGAQHLDGFIEYFYGNGERMTVFPAVGE